MKSSNTRRFRRRAIPSKTEGSFFKKESQETFFGSPSRESFFQPSSVHSPSINIQRKGDDCINAETKVQRVGDKKEEDKKVMRAADKKEEEKLQREPDKKEEEQVQRAEDKKEEDTVHKKEGDASLGSGKNIHNYINSLKGSGRPITPEANQFFSSKMGYDFSEVKIHDDKEAAESANQINARAYTIGDNIVFNEGRYDTESTEGKKLMAHELTHVVQNRRGKAEEIVSRQRAGRFRPRRTRADLLNALMQPNSPLWRQLNPAADSPVNCPATAAAVDEYLGTGRVSPAAAGDTLSTFEFAAGPMSAPYTSFAQVRSVLSEERSFAVIRAIRTPEYLQANPGITREHFFTAVRYHDQVVLIDAYGSGRVIHNVDDFISQQGFGTFSLYRGQFRVTHRSFDDGPDL